MVDSFIENINIQLGDIIELIAPDSEKYNQQKFYIKYIDISKIVLININTKELIYIRLKNGELIDKSIEAIILLSSPD